MHAVEVTALLVTALVKVKIRILKVVIVYETWCNTCLKNHRNMCDDTDEDQVIYDGEWLDRVETELIKMKGTIDEKRKRDANENENVDGSYYRYIGESSHSSYEREGGNT